MPFNDHFSGHAAEYAKYRPIYPDNLFQFLAKQCQNTSLAWDCATGSGQSAAALAHYFNRVEATDASAKQIAAALPVARVNYRVASAEKSGLPDTCCDLITVAQAAHWFDLDKFYCECQRVAKPGAIIAIWCYEKFSISPDIDQLVDYLYQDILGPYWPPQRAFIDSGYADLPFLFEQRPAPLFHMQCHWDLHQTLGYLNTWSATKRYESANGQNPVSGLQENFEKMWGKDSERKLVNWPLRLKLGCVRPPVIING